MVRVWWEGDTAYYTGECKGYNAETETHTVQYMDGEKHEEPLLDFATKFLLQPPFPKTYPFRSDEEVQVASKSGEARLARLERRRRGQLQQEAVMEEATVPRTIEEA